LGERLVGKGMLNGGFQPFEMPHTFKGMEQRKVPRGLEEL